MRAGAGQATHRRRIVYNNSILGECDASTRTDFPLVCLQYDTRPVTSLVSFLSFLLACRQSFNALITISVFSLQKLVEALRENENIRKVNLESNYLSGSMLRDLIEALLEKQLVVEFRAANQRPAILGNRVEMEISQLVAQNKTLLKLGLNLDVPAARHTIASQLQQNNDNCKALRFPNDRTHTLTALFSSFL